MNSRIIFGSIVLTMIGTLALYKHFYVDSSLNKTETDTIKQEIVTPIGNVVSSRPAKVVTKKETKIKATPSGNTVTTVREIQTINYRKDNKVSAEVICKEALTIKCNKITYGIGYERRVFDSPVFLGGGISADGDVKLSISVEF